MNYKNSYGNKLKIEKQIRALWSEMKFRVFLQKFFNEKFKKKIKFVQIFQNRIQVEREDTFQ